MAKEGYGIRLILGLIEDEKYLALEGVGQIIRDKAFVHTKGEFSAWRVLYTQRGESWIKYDGFDIDKIVDNADGKGVEPYEEDYDEDDECDCDNCDEEDCEGREEGWNIKHTDEDLMTYYPGLDMFVPKTGLKIWGQMELLIREEIDNEIIEDLRKVVAK